MRRNCPTSGEIARSRRAWGVPSDAGDVAKVSTLRILEAFRKANPDIIPVSSLGLELPGGAQEARVRRTDDDKLAIGLGDDTFVGYSPGTLPSRLQLEVRSGRMAVAVATSAPATVIERLAETAAAHAAHLVLERWPLGLADDVEVWQPLPPSLPLMRRMKAELDPRATFAPGRFVGRI